MNGKDIRLSRIFHPETKRACLVPLDHGVTMGPIEGIRNIWPLIEQVVAGGADGIVLHKGYLNKVKSQIPATRSSGYILHLSASTLLSKDPSHKVIVGSVEEALKMGADAVSIHVNLGTEHESDMIQQFGAVSKACLDWGMPLLAMMYSKTEPVSGADIAHAVRLAEELGADIVKVEYPGSEEQMENLMGGVDIPVLVAGGSLTGIKDVLSMINESLLAGASGVAIGRNVFQSGNPETTMRIISSLVHGSLTYRECLFELRKLEDRGYVNR
ncbi:2-amino-3,7-dideoxy-D-threo-hept-6-ulosonate synthase [Paenibacillus sp. FJAT-26967]|uniref:2-amino-3,7-dideoxy-D-threo-hept-6-ulosonate synthase n=1 Tax=Paenibacillus sp. FJAT-26967 TaxID=1729690 RepID=UPI00083885F2|nr:2-amino-3,7-dideoxy-D-threo-hept-6-ulosonate synthase [Paenibacillus sp. FJAT-26967]